MAPICSATTATFLMAAALVVGGCAQGDATVKVSGRIETTKIYVDLPGIPAPECGTHEVHVSNGAGEVLLVGDSTLDDKVLESSSSGGSVRTLVCKSSYDFDVPESQVYKVAVPSAGELGVTGIWERTVNRNGDTLVVDPLLYMYSAG